MNKNGLKILSLFLSLGILLTFSSCSEDDDPIIIDTSGGDGDGGFAVSDGLYIVGIDGDSTVTDGMKLAATNSNGTELNVPLPRSGFSTVYAYLSAGNYIFANIESRAVTSSFGGAVTTVDSVGAVADGFDVIALEESGAAFSIAEAGVYHVAFDDQTDKAYLFAVDRWGILGTSLELGFSEDVDLVEQDGASAAGVTWQGTQIVIRPGIFKVRYNDSWNLFTPDEYDIFMNFGGTADALEVGAGDIAFDGEAGEYTVTLTLDEFGGFALDLERTGDAPVVTFDPNDFQFGIIGDGTANGWDGDRNMFYKGIVNDAHTWYSVITFVADASFKFRTNDAWDFNLGGDLANLTSGGADLSTPGAGSYYITLQTADEGMTWTATAVEEGWGIIGAATPTGWDSDTDLTADGFADGVTTYSITIDLGADEYKFRAGNAWDFNLGGDPSALEADGGNLSISEAGSYTVVLSYDGETYSSTATKN